jgi:hypothetical protein
MWKLEIVISAHLRKKLQSSICFYLIYGGKESCLILYRERFRFWPPRHQSYMARRHQFKTSCILMQNDFVSLWLLETLQYVWILLTIMMYWMVVKLSYQRARYSCYKVFGGKYMNWCSFIFLLLEVFAYLKLCTICCLITLNEILQLGRYSLNTIVQEMVMNQQSRLNKNYV